MRVFIPLQRHPGFRVSGILFLNTFLPVIVGATRNSLWNAWPTCASNSFFPCCTGERGRSPMRLGVIAGLAIGWFFAPDNKSTGAGLSALSPLALAFVAGYSVDLLFTAMDRLVAAFSGPAPTQPDQSGSRPSQLPKTAKSSINSLAAPPAAAAV